MERWILQRRIFCFEECVIAELMQLRTGRKVTVDGVVYFVLLTIVVMLLWFTLLLLFYTGQMYRTYLGYQSIGKATQVPRSWIGEWVSIVQQHARNK